jgi:hypothetical protein
MNYLPPGEKELKMMGRSSPMYEGDGYIHAAPSSAESVVAAPAGSLLGRVADWFFSRISADRAREVESYVAGAMNERDLAQRLHRIEGGNALFAA